MAEPKLSLNKSLQVRATLSDEQSKQISAMYSNLSKNIAKEANGYSKDASVSGSIKRSYLKKLQEQINTEMKNISSASKNIITSNMTKTVEAVVKDNVTFAESLKVFEIKGAFSNVPTNIVNSINSGTVYGKTDWTLSKALWSDVSNKQKEIQSIVAQGVAANKSSYDIAKDLEQYVDPKAAKPWDWNKVYPGTARKIDYNAQRLSRTLVSHAYQQSMIATAKNNPFVTGFKWMSSNGGRTCPLCASRDGEIYSADDLPMDHPNGMCTWRAVTKEEIGSDIADWYNSPAGTYPDIDEYAKTLGYKGVEIVDKVGYDYKKAIQGYHNPNFNGFQADTWKAYKQKGGEAEYNAKMDKFIGVVNDRIKNSPLASRTSKDGLEGILDSGRFKSTYETGKRNEAYIVNRNRIEKAMFDVSDGIDAVKRPIYGYVDDGLVSSNVSKYGDYNIILKDAVKNRASYSIGDSLNSEVKPFLDASEITGEHVQAGLPYVYKTAEQMSKNLSYVETQIHGGLTVDDIAEVVLPKNASKTLIEKIEKAGIKWSLKK